MTAFPVTLRPNPLSLANVTHLMPAGLTIEEMLASYPTELPIGFEQFGIVNLNGHIVPRELWRSVRVKRDRGDQPVSIALYLVPQNGGQGGGKQTAMLIGTIAVIAAAAAVSGGLLGPAGLGLSAGLAAGTWGAAAAGAAISIGGTLALSALAPPPVSSSARRGGGTNAFQQIAGIQANPLAPLQTIPTVLGQLMASPPHLIRPYTKMVANKVRAYACVGFSGALDITDVRINGVPETTFTDVDVHTSETGSAMTLATENVWEEMPNERLSRHDVVQNDSAGRELVDQTTPTNSEPKFHYFRTKGIPSKVRIRLYFPAGHSYINDAGNSQPAETWVQIEARVAGGSFLKLPVLIYTGEFKGEKRSQITLQWGTSSASSIGNAGGGTFHAGAVSTIGRGNAWEYDSHADYNFAADPDDNAKNIQLDGEQGFIIHMSTTTFPQTNEYEIRIRRSSTRLESAVTGVVDDNLFGVETEAGVDKVFGSNDNANQHKTMSEIIVESFATVRSGNPLVTSGLSYIEVDAEGVNIETISATWQSKSNNWNGSSWPTAGTTATSNPASLFRHVLLNTTLNAEPLNEDLLEDAAGESLVTWYTYCNSEGLECNMIADGRPLEEILQIIAACGHAAVRRSDKWGVIIEKDRSADPITQLFSPRNSWNNSVRKLFPDPPLDGLFVTYINEAEDYVADEVEVTYTAGDNVEAIEYPGITTLAQAQMRARLDLRQRALRSKFYTFMTDTQGIVSQRGDLVGYVHDIIDSARLGARINKLVFNSGGDATGVILDTAVQPYQIGADIFALDNVFSVGDIFASQPVGIVILKLDGTFVTRTIDQTGLDANSVASKQVNFTAVISGLGGSSTDFIGAEVAIGSLSSEYRRCLVFDIQWDQELNATMVLVDEAPEIHPL